MTEDETDPEPDPVPDADAATPTPRVVWIVAGVAVLLAAGLLLQTLRLSSRDDELADTSEQLDERATQAGDRQAVLLTASALAEALLSYDYQDLEGSLARVEEHIGGQFAEVYPEIFRTVQTPVITQLQAVATAAVDRIFVTEVDGDTASAIVLVDLTVQSTAGTRSLTGTYLRMDLVRRDGEWFVDTIPERISSSGETLDGIPVPGDTAATTSTTAPAG